MSKKKEEQAKQEAFQQEIRRIKTPRGNQCFAIVEQRVGASRMRAKCFDGKDRICKIPGRLKRRLWVREGDIVIVEPWEFGGEEKGNILYKYSKSQVGFMKQRGYLKKLDELDEF